ncbi:hypothetical protein O181_090778 [Austropuccinia psidii MF-1]|uniref:Uncharacterized protein n=1 Tax=Austropuccinia psidii MF-1 TaxID=1389203 RepID=A0A9Q3IVM6_9BASI|nr:hypothetical protein [Austropuccinia psidii MF-1]
MLTYCPPNMPPMLLTILMLTKCPQHASNTAYHPYACIVPSKHASEIALIPAQSSMLLIILTLLQCPQDETMIPPPISALNTP